MKGPSPFGRLGSERGAILIQVATALLMFTMLSAFVVDYGAQLIGRNQIQNAVDAAALAGATSLAYDSYTDRTPAGPAQSAARAVAVKNVVWQDPPSVDVDANVTCADTFNAGTSGTPILACVQVTAYRNAEHANAIPTVFARLMNVFSFGVAATAIAEAKAANATDCLKPLAVPDRWIERYPAPGPWSAASTFDRWDPMNPGMLFPPATRDSYTAPVPNSPMTGLTLEDNFGTQVVLKEGSLTSPIATISPWRYLPVQIPGSRWGPNALRLNTNSCAATKVRLALRDPFTPTRLNIVLGGVPANAALIAQGLNDLVADDPGAHWNAITQRVEGSCADLEVGRCGSMSPRIIAMALYDPADLADASEAGAATGVLVTNFVGFFIESVAGTDATGRIVRHPGQRDEDAITLPDASSFLRASMLVQ
jgi:Flp pilus assembly protein TadG